jgi:serine/threonine protein kinase
MIGKSISHYRIVEKLGEGGMGEVYLAQDTKLNRKVALKFLPAQYSSDESFKARFKREAQAAAALNHPNIITIHEVSEFEGRPYIAMEYVEGQSLRDLIVGKDMSLGQVLHIIRG